MKKKFLAGVFACDHRKIAIILAALFMLGLLPILYLSGYVHATGDDYGYGYPAHLAWLETHNLFQTMKAAAGMTKQCWYGWQGTWFTMFLMALQPEVFSPNLYGIVPWVMLAVIIGSTSLVLHYLLVKKLKISAATFFCVDLLVLTAMIQFFPSTKSGIFWYNGTVHYIVPYGLAMAAMYCFFRFADEDGRARWFWGACVCMTLLGGSSYLAALLAPIVLIYVVLFHIQKKRFVRRLFFPLLLEAVGLYVSMISPGNKNRGGEDFGFHIGRILTTIGRCFVEGFSGIARYVRQYPAALVLMAVAFFLLYEAFRRQERQVFSFPLPGAFAALMFATWCAMFAPGLYAGVDVSGGVPNTIWQVFLLALLAVLTYCAGWLADRHKRRQKAYDVGKTRLRVFLPILLLLLLFVFSRKGTLKDTTFYKCWDFIVTGQADDYREQMQERLSILLDPSAKEVELPAMNSEQGPFMHMEVLEDPNAWSNTVVRQFFGKDRVVRVPRRQ